MVEVVGRVRGQLVHWFTVDGVAAVAVLTLRSPRPVAAGPTACSPVVTESKPRSEWIR